MLGIIIIVNPIVPSTCLYRQTPETLLHSHRLEGPERAACVSLKCAKKRRKTCMCHTELSEKKESAHLRHAAHLESSYLTYPPRNHESLCQHHLRLLSLRQGPKSCLLRNQCPSLLRRPLPHRSTITTRTYTTCTSAHGAVSQIMTTIATSDARCATSETTLLPGPRAGTTTSTAMSARPLKSRGIGRETGVEVEAGCENTTRTTMRSGGPQ